MLEIIINILLVLAFVALSCLTYYFDIKRKLQEKVNGAISDAEDLERDGAEKMAAVVDSLLSIIPPIFKPFLTRKAVEKIVQAAFDKIEEYAQKQENK